ncbi:expressed unknown protein [Seminavis robusta]|uniref:Uncharacterized protein n=1 Tax=Seminavis robusta TaxID=568900 RepID=A0A9N8F4Y2_9STRA|nr:expressed unknown protein [Seminavis robusta]|eukprot:Sro3850_g351460.1 n/a (469) ;mRNA; r:2587-4077
MIFYPIVVGKNCKVSGMIGPGAQIGDGSKVEKLSAVEEGALVPNAVVARGSPAYNAGPFEHKESIYWADSLLSVFKMVWAISEAYHFFALSSLVHFTLNRILPSWRYGGVLHWFLLFPLTSFLALLTSIALKWLLIAAWALIPFFGQSKLWHFILFLHGLDADMTSTLSHPYTVFFPSKVDFVKIRCSFVPSSSLDLGTKADSKIEIINSSIGYNSNLHAGVKIMKSMIPPRSNVSDSVCDWNHSDTSRTVSSLTLLLPEVEQQLLNTVLFFSIIPSYEIGLAATKISSLTIVVLGLALAVTVQLFVWILLTHAVEKILLILPHYAQQGFFGIYINHVRQFRAGNWLWMVLYGTPMFACCARFMGAEVDGDLWYFGTSLYEYGKLHFKGSVIVDNSHVSGHYIDRNGLAIDDTYVSGLLLPGCYASAGAEVFGPENGPWKVFLRSDCNKDPVDVELGSNATSSVIIEA